MSAPATLRTFDGAEWELRATTQTGTALYAVKGAPKCCPPYVMATLTELAEHGIQSTELAAAVAELGALPVPVGSKPTLRPHIAELEKAAVEARSALGALCHDLEDPGSHALGALYLLTQATLWTDSKPDDATQALAKHDGAVLKQAAEDLMAACPEHSDADEVWMDCPCEYAEELVRKAELVETGSTS